MPKRALVLVHSYYVRDTRPRRHAPALADAGWEVDVVCARDRGERARERIGGVLVRRLPARRRRQGKLRYVFEYLSFTLMAALVVAARHVRRRYRVVYVIGVPNMLVFAAAVPRLLGARVLLDMRDPLPEFFRAKYGLGERHPAVRALLAEERLSARFASHVLTVHESMAALYRRTGVDPARITVVRNAPDPGLFDQPPRPRDPDGRTMLFNGTIAAHYGLEVAIRAVARLRGEIPGLRLRIVTKNTGAHVGRLRRIAEEEGVADRVSIEEPVPLDRVPALVAEAWVGVQPGRDDPLMRYSLSAKVLEWARLGLPVVCGRTEPLAEVFTAGEVAFHGLGDLEELTERLRDAHADPDAMAERAERARAAAGRISYDEEIARLLAVFDEAAAASVAVA